MTLAQQLRKEGRQEGRKEGHKEGRQEGHKEGRQEGRREDILEALEIRFGVVPMGLSEAIRVIHDESRLRELLRIAIQAPSLDDFSRSL